MEDVTEEKPTENQIPKSQSKTKTVAGWVIAALALLALAGFLIYFFVFYSGGDPEPSVRTVNLVNRSNRIMAPGDLVRFTPFQTLVEPSMVSKTLSRWKKNGSSTRLAALTTNVMSSFKVVGSLSTLELPISHVFGTGATLTLPDNLPTGQDLTVIMYDQTKQEIGRSAKLRIESRGTPYRPYHKRLSSLGEKYRFRVAEAPLDSEFKLILSKQYMADTSFDMLVDDFKLNADGVGQFTIRKDIPGPFYVRLLAALPDEPYHLVHEDPEPVRVRIPDLLKTFHWRGLRCATPSRAPGAVLSFDIESEREAWPPTPKLFFYTSTDKVLWIPDYRGGQGTFRLAPNGSQGSFEYTLPSIPRNHWIKVRLPTLGFELVSDELVMTSSGAFVYQLVDPDPSSGTSRTKPKRLLAKWSRTGPRPSVFNWEHSLDHGISWRPLPNAPASFESLDSDGELLFDVPIPVFVPSVYYLVRVNGASVSLFVDPVGVFTIHHLQLLAPAVCSGTVLPVLIHYSNDELDSIRIQGLFDKLVASSGSLEIVSLAIEWSQHSIVLWIRVLGLTVGSWSLSTVRAGETVVSNTIPIRPFSESNLVLYGDRLEEFAVHRSAELESSLRSTDLLGKTFEPGQKAYFQLFGFIGTSAVLETSYYDTNRQQWTSLNGRAWSPVSPGYRLEVIIPDVSDRDVLVRVGSAISGYLYAHLPVVRPIEVDFPSDADTIVYLDSQYAGFKRFARSTLAYFNARVRYRGRVDREFLLNGMVRVGMNSRSNPLTGQEWSSEGTLPDVQVSYIGYNETSGETEFGVHWVVHESDYFLAIANGSDMDRMAFQLVFLAWDASIPRGGKLKFVSSVSTHLMSVRRFSEYALDYSSSYDVLKAKQGAVTRLIDMNQEGTLTFAPDGQEPLHVFLWSPDYVFGEDSGYLVATPRNEIVSTDTNSFSSGPRLSKDLVEAFGQNMEWPENQDLKVRVSSQDPNSFSSFVRPDQPFDEPGRVWTLVFQARHVRMRLMKKPGKGRVVSAKESK
jgi:hypothetical protein